MTVSTVFKLKLDDPKILSGSLSIISDFITEATFAITKDSMGLIAMDPSNISMVILNLLSSAFIEYTVDSDEEITINLDILNQALKRAKSGEILTLSKEKNQLEITVTGKSTKKFHIPLLEKESRDKKIPSLEFNTALELDAKEFREYIDDASIAGDALTFNAVGNKFNLSAGDTGRKASIELKEGSDALIKLEIKELSKSIYSAEYLKKMAKASSLADTVLVQFSKDYPLRLDFKALNKMQMSFILAPRIENK